MALTKDFRETIRERAQREPQFRKVLLREAIELMLSGDEKTGRAILRNYSRRIALRPEHSHEAVGWDGCRFFQLPKSDRSVDIRTCSAFSLIFRHRKA